MCKLCHQLLLDMNGLMTCISTPLFTLRIIVDLLKMNVAPQAVFQTLKAMCAGQRVAAESGAGESSAASHTTSANIATAEPRGLYLKLG